MSGSQRFLLSGICLMSLLLVSMARPGIVLSWSLDSKHSVYKYTGYYSSTTYIQYLFTDDGTAIYGVNRRSEGVGSYGADDHNSKMVVLEVLGVINGILGIYRSIASIWGPNEFDNLNAQFKEASYKLDQINQ